MKSLGRNGDNYIVFPALMDNTNMNIPRSAMAVIPAIYVPKNIYVTIAIMKITMIGMTYPKVSFMFYPFCDFLELYYKWIKNNSDIRPCFGEI